jgi:hypothetical protein
VRICALTVDQPTRPLLAVGLSRLALEAATGLDTALIPAILRSTNGGRFARPLAVSVPLKVGILTEVELGVHHVCERSAAEDRSASCGSASRVPAVRG